jgi:hypothetical protein
MPLAFKLTVDSKGIDVALRELADEAKVAPGVAFKNEAKQLSKLLIKLTPPKTYSQGRKAVAGDIGRVFTSIPRIIKYAKDHSRVNDIAGFNTALKKAYRKGDDAELERLLTGPIGVHTSSVKPYMRNGVQVSGYTAKRNGRPMFPMIAGGSTRMSGNLDPKLHTNRRNRRGRVLGDKTSQLVKNAELNRYIKKVQQSVGWHAGGWVALARASGYPAPKWVTKHGIPAASGRATLRTSKNPFIKATNYRTSIPGYQRTVDGVVAQRAKIIRDNLEKLIKGKAVNLGFKRVG